MPRDLVQTRADPDTVEALEDFADECDISRSEAIRRLLRTGLAHEGYPIAATDGAGTGQIADRLEAIEDRQAKQENADRLHTAALLTGLLYVVASITLGLTGLIWAAVGIAAISSMAAATYYRNRAGELDE